MLYVLMYTTRTHEFIVATYATAAEAQAHIRRETKSSSPVDALGNVFTVHALPVVAVA